MIDFTLHLGDCIDTLRTLPTASIDCVLADPPYSINTKSDGQGKLNPWADRVNAALWYREWIGECRRVLKPSGCLWSFLNWRSLVTFQKAADDLYWSIESLLVWDKCWIGPGGPKGLRPSYELVALWAGERFSIENRGIPDIARFKWSSLKPSGHPAEKPINLVRWLIEISTKPGAVVYDPFTGSGTTGIACAQTGRDFIGSEIDPNWHEYALGVIRAAQQQPSLFTEAS
jgi:DNA modification methylase